MSRLFITEREIQFISDITKEVYKDINGQKIILYPISELKTLSDDVYNEAVKKVYDSPIELEAMIDAITDAGTVTDKFGADKEYKVEAFIHYQDILDRGIDITLGDYFTYGSVVYEITNITRIKNIFGQVENNVGLHIIGTRAREGAIDVILHGPTDKKYTDADATQDTFYQQRGAATNKQGPTDDKRFLIEKGVIEPISGPKEVSSLGSEHARNAFYGEDD